MSLTRGAKPLPGIFIPKEEVNNRVANYQANKHPLLSDAIQRPDTRSAWYSLEQFEELMREMYYLNADGLRIYLGAYDQNDPNYPGMTTVIFVPTYMDENSGNHTDIVIEEDQVFQERLEAAGSAKLLGAARKNFDTIGLCPPSCGGHAFAYPLQG